MSGGIVADHSVVDPIVVASALATTSWHTNIKTHYKPL